MKDSKIANLINPLIAIFLFYGISGCTSKTTNIKKTENCNGKLENLSEVENPEQFESFIKTIKNKDCLELKKWLSDHFFYSLDEVMVYIPFYKKNNYTNGADICDFFYNQKTFQSIIFEESNVNNVISPYGLIQYANEIKIFGTPNIDSKPYEAILQVSACINGTPDTGLETLFNFECYSKPVSKCKFKGVYSWTRINTNN
ncbi:hypothetical protein [Leptospira limi]|uniref:Lipoprotein n=1 Tax=Leptospira limi TaxID=2950023 RepID=A0ABT3M238_9LEPT|nr:hypothetical protein [Leptospira limi]MCW7464044.1 hypothetical protein [Leptospira limi]